MADLYLDHDVDHTLVTWLNREQHTARTADGLGRSGAADYEHLLLAQKQQWILVTHNRWDYRLLHGAWRHWLPALWPEHTVPAHAGILVIPQPIRPRRYWLPDHAAHEVAALFATGVDLTNALYRWRPARGWVKY